MCRGVSLPGNLSYPLVGSSLLDSILPVVCNVPSSDEFVNKDRQRVIAIVGHLDEPTDGVRDYCSRLSDSLREQGVELSLAEVLWVKSGWLRALRDIRANLPASTGDWVLLQYTALAWSRRSFPFGVLGVAWSLRSRGVRLAVVFHEPSGFPARGAWAWLRFHCQEWIIRRLYKLAELAIFTVPLSKVPWILSEETKARFIPIGSNIPGLVADRQAQPNSADLRKTVAVFGITPVTRTKWEVEEISRALREANKRIARLRLVVFGRGALDARGLLEKTLESSGVELSVQGILPAERIAEILSQSDALLYVRDNLTPQHGCVLAAIACGIPLVSYGHPTECFPLNEAGVMLAPAGNREAFAAALTRVLCDDELWNRLRESNLAAHKKYFAWDEIARKYVNGFKAHPESRPSYTGSRAASQVKMADTAPSASGDVAKGMSAR